MRVRRLIKWLLMGIGGVVAVALLGVAGIYVFIGIELDRTFEVSGTIIDVPDDSASIAEGERLARLRGCNGGCHGDTVNGGVFFDLPDGTRVVVPDLGRTAQDFSVQELEQAIRHGIRPDGTSVMFAMPSSMFYHLSDEDLGAIIAFLKSQDAADVLLPATMLAPLGRLMFFYYGQLIGSVLSAEVIDHSAPRIRPAKSDPVANGRYLAMTICTECHGEDLRGGFDEFAPTLAIVAAYSIGDFRKLMRTGEPVGGRELDLMASVAQSRFAHFTDSEINNLHAFLQTLALTAPEQ